ncbi:MAG: hypothetical protein ACI9MC_004294, partial [Kiritimatiellia bacterium]
MTLCRAHQHGTVATAGAGAYRVARAAAEGSTMSHLPCSVRKSAPYVIALVASLLMCSTAEARPKKPDLKLKLEDRMLPLQDACFPSGLRVVLQEDHTHPIVSMTTIIDGGFANDPPGQQGIAHLMEHLWFRSLHDGYPVNATIEALGGRYNAWTSGDTIAFRTVAPTKALDTLLTMEVAKLSDPLRGVDDAIVDIEREVVRNETKLGYRPLQDVVRARLYEALLPEGDPRANLTHAKLDAIDHASLTAYTKERWRPAHTTLVVVGDMSVQELWTAVTTQLPFEILGDPERPSATTGTCASRVGEPATVPEPRQKRPDPIRATVDDRMIVTAWNLPGSWREHDVLYEISAGVLAHFTSQRTGVPVHCQVWPGRQTAAMVCQAVVKGPGQAVRVKRNLIATSKDLSVESAKPMLAETLELIYAGERRRLFESMDDVGGLDSGRGYMLASKLHHTASSTYVTDRVRSLHAMTVDGLSHVFSHDLHPSRMVVLDVEPVEASEESLSNGSESR